MSGPMRMIWTAVLLAGAVAVVNARPTPTYILKGYSFGPMPGVKTAEIEAKLPRKPGARITDADVVAEEAIVERELKARHVQGRLFASTAEKNGRVWIIFDLVREPVRVLESQVFVGASHMSQEALVTATGLKPGDTLSPDRLNAARRGIFALYGKAEFARAISIRLRMQTSIPIKGLGDEKTKLTWFVGESTSLRR